MRFSCIKVVIFNFIKFKTVIYFCEKYQHFQSSVSHEPSEIILICWFNAQETF